MPDQDKGTPCEVCGSQPATHCTACFDARDLELRAIIARKDRALRTATAEHARSVGQTIDAVADKAIEVSAEVLELRQKLADVQVENGQLKGKIEALNPQPTEACARYAVLLSELDAMDEAAYLGDGGEAVRDEMDTCWWKMAEWERADLNQQGHARAYRGFKARVRDLEDANALLKIENERLKKQWADHSCADLC